VSAITEADEEIDLAEDDYIRALADALEVPDDARDGLTLEIETLRDDLARVRKEPPPPPPGKRG
jgi:hypothetical protein